MKRIKDMINKPLKLNEKIFKKYILEKMVIEHYENNDKLMSHSKIISFLLDNYDPGSGDSNSNKCKKCKHICAECKYYQFYSEIHEKPDCKHNPTTKLNCVTGYKDTIFTKCEVKNKNGKCPYFEKRAELSIEKQLIDFLEEYKDNTDDRYSFKKFKETTIELLLNLINCNSSTPELFLNQLKSFKEFFYTQYIEDEDDYDDEQENEKKYKKFTESIKKLIEFLEEF